MQKTAEGRELVERQKDLIEKAMADRINGLFKGQYYFEVKPGEYKVCTCNEIMALKREMKQTAEGRELLERQKDLIEKAIAEKRASLDKGRYYFEIKPGEYKECVCDDIMRYRRQMRKTSEGRELLERQKDLIEQAIAYKKEQLGGSDKKLEEYLDKFEDFPSWIRNNKKVSQTLTDKNYELEVVKHLGKGYDVIQSNYGESNGLRQPVLDTELLHQYNFLQQSTVKEIYEKSVITESLKEYSKKLTTDIGISGSYKCFSGSVNTSFGSEEAKTTSRYYATHTMNSKDFDFYTAMPGEGEQKYKNYRYFLTKTAKREINDRNFPVDKLVEKYGQYVLVGLTSGAKQDYNISVEKNKVFSKEDFSLKVKASVKAVFASASVEVGHSSSVSQASFDQSSKKMIRTVGYGFAVDPTLLDKDIRSRIEFQNSASPDRQNMIDYSRVLGKNSLIPLYELADDVIRRADIKSQITEKLEGAGKDLTDPTDPTIYKNHLVGIRIGLANEGWDDAVAKANGDDWQYGDPKYEAPVVWKLMTSSPFSAKGADLNEGVTKGGRDYIVLNLGWKPKNIASGAIPIRDIFVTGTKIKDNVYSLYTTHNGYKGSWRFLHKDLNYNAGGAYLYLAWTGGGEKKPIVDMVLCIGKPKDLYPGWEVVTYQGTDIPANLNEGTTGAEIYLVIKREE